MAKLSPKTAVLPEIKPVMAYKDLALQRGKCLTKKRIQQAKKNLVETESKFKLDKFETSPCFIQTLLVLF